ncbi:MAG: TorD/DmsD family molecular chaperone [Bacillota bacterium]
METTPAFYPGEVEKAKTRAKVYELLARGFLREPDMTFLHSFSRLVKAFEEEGFTVGEGPWCSPQDWEGLRQEYFDRFFVPWSDLFVPPFESAVTGREISNGRLRYGILNGVETHHVMDCYRAVNFDPWKLDTYKPLKEMPFADYLGFELAFMAFLGYAEGEAHRKLGLTQGLQWRRLQQDFLTQHLGLWIHDYALLARETGKGFFSSLAGIASVWVGDDCRQIQQGEKERLLS